jgi:hypothetical protein
MGRMIRALGVSVVIGWSIVSIGSGSTPNGPTPTPTPTVTSVAVKGNAALTAIGQMTQLNATATLSNGTTQDVTATASWQTSDPTVATVTGGLVTGVNFGQVTITATYQGGNGMLAVSLQLNVTGTWKGNSADSAGIVQMTFVLLQTGVTATGTGTYTTNSGSGTGTFTGTISPSSNTITFSIGGTAGGCTFSVTGNGSVTGNSFGGTYTGTNSCSGPLAHGVLTLTKQ